MTFQASIEKLRTKVGAVSDVGAILKFDCGADGAVVIDGKTKPHTVELGNRDDMDVTIILTAAMFTDIVNGKVNPGIAFVKGQIKVKGDKAPLLKLQKIL